MTYVLASSLEDMQLSDYILIHEDALQVSQTISHRICQRKSGTFALNIAYLYIMLSVLYLIIYIILFLLEKLLNSSGRELRRALFSLKQLFQVRVTKICLKGLVLLLFLEQNWLPGPSLT